MTLSGADCRCRQCYDFLVKALSTFSGPSSQSQDIATRAIKVALIHPKIYHFGSLTSSPAVQALQHSSPQYHQLLTVFTSGTIKDFTALTSKHPSFLSSAKPTPLPEEPLLEKIRLLTLQELASNTPSRSLPYSDIASTLQVPASEVETCIIDCVRVGLVEGRMSQREKVFLVNGWKSRGGKLKKEDWVAIQDRLKMWKEGLKGVLEVVRRGRDEAVEAKMGGGNAVANTQGAPAGAEGRRGGGGGYGQRRGGMMNGERGGGGGREIGVGGD